MALDSLTVRILDFDGTNFSLVEFEFLVDCVPERANPVGSLYFIAQHTDFARSLETDLVREHVATLLKKVPWVTIYPVPTET